MAEAPENPETRPQLVGYTLSSLCSMFMGPQLLTGIFKDVLVRHFQEGNIEHPALRRLIWQPTETTGILIESISRWNPKTTGKRPAVIIKRNAFRNRRVGIDDRRMMGGELGGDSHYATMWIGSHTLFCLGGEGAQVELLATEVQRELTEFGPLLREILQLPRFQVISIGAVSEIEESKESFVVPVVVGYVYEERWTTSQQAPSLKNISLSVLLDL